jgi:DNA-binding SARP family transcriptional activator
MTAPEPRADEREPPLRLHLLGSPKWQRSGAAPAPLPEKDAALLARLALEGAQSRSALCDLLWPQSTPAQASASLRQRASRLRALAGLPFIELGASVRLHADVWVDANHIDELPDELLLGTQALLAGVDLGDHGELDQWLARARNAVAERCAGVLAARAEALQAEGRLHEALALARGIVALVPLGEQGWRRLIRLHYLRGDRAEAQDTYWRLNALLRDELGIRPSAETQAMLQTVEAAEPAPARGRRPVPLSLLRPPVLVGRQAPWAAMAAAWQLPQPFLLVGEAGLGKSRLLDAFVHGLDGLVCERARPGDQASPDALLGRLLLLIEQNFAPQADATVRGELARLRPEFGTPPTATANAAVLRHAIEQWLRAAMAAGLRAIAIDDLHNADTASLEALRWLAASPALATLHIAMASRPWAADTAGNVLSAWLEDSLRPARIDLQPLSRAELSSLLASLALPALLDERMVAQLYRHAGGHPLYTLATLQHAVANGADLQRPQSLAPPQSVQALLDARLRDVPPVARDLLQVAAVGGMDLTVERAAQLLGQTPLSLSDAWATLEAHNVLRGESFSHDLVHEAALRAAPLGLQQVLHRQWAALLAGIAGVPPARVALHWEQGLRWSEAGHCWHAAASAARLAGRLSEQTELFERAARCHAQAGDAAAQFEALLARLDGLKLRHGAAAVLAVLPEVEALADTTLRRLRCRVVHMEALIDQARAAEAVAQALPALDEVRQHPEWASDVHAHHAIALAQLHQPDEALASALQAVQLARAAAAPAKLLTAANALVFVHWSAGRLGDAVAAHREELQCAEALGDRALAAVSEGSLAALLAAVGDVRATHAHAARARARQSALGLADNSTQLVLVNTVLGAAAAALGRFDEALEALRQAVEMAGQDASGPVRAKATLTLAALWLTLGRPDEARALTVELPADTPPGMQMQAAWVLARAALAEGRSADVHWAAFDRLDRAHDDLPPVQNAVFEGSYHGPAPQAIDRLQRCRAQCAALGLHGGARALHWRELVRWLEIPGPAATAAALECAQALHPHAEDGMSAKCTPPETWMSLADAYARHGDTTRQQACEAAARRWLTRALARLAPEHRAAYSQASITNRRLLAPGTPP